MNDPYNPVKKPSGCWKWSGCMLTIVSGLLIAFFVWMIVDSEKEMDKSRQEYYESQKEYEEALKAYEADSTLFQDSLKNCVKPEYHPRGHIGVNIGAAFFAVFILFLLIPLGIVTANIIDETKEKPKDGHCPRCDGMVRDEDHYCSHCGEKL